MRKKELKIGIIAVVILLGTWAGLRFLNGISIFGGNNTYYVYFENAGGLQSAAPVMLNGVKIGKVAEITVKPDNVKDVEIALSVPHRYRIPVGSHAKIYSSGFLTSKAIELIYSDSSAVVENGGRLLPEETSDIMDLAGSELEYFKGKVTVLIDNINTALTSINTLVAENSTNIHGTIEHLNSATGDLSEILQHRRGEIENVVSNLNEFSAKLAANGERLDSIMCNVNDITGQLEREKAAESLSKSLAELNAILARINAGEGSLGRLSKDEQLYTNLTAASDNLSQLLSDLKENPKRYVHFSLFGRSETKAAAKRAKAEKKTAKADKKTAKSEAKQD